MKCSQHLSSSRLFRCNTHVRVCNLRWCKCNAALYSARIQIPASYTVAAPISPTQFESGERRSSKGKWDAECKETVALEEKDQPSCIKPFVSESAHLVCHYKEHLSPPVVLLLLNLSVCMHFGYDVIYRCTQAKLLSTPEQIQHSARSSSATAFDGGR